MSGADVRGWSESQILEAVGEKVGLVRTPRVLGFEAEADFSV